ncbi:MAG: alpha/beta hydrolase-fold protein [Gemmatimonadaceae bacterium]
MRLHLLLGAAVVATAATGASGCRSGRAPSPVGAEYLTPYGPPTRPFSPAVRVGNMLYLSGQIGTGADGAVVPGGIGAETRQTMENIKDVLEKTGSSLDRVVKCTVMLADMREWDAMNVVYAGYFPRDKPARSALGANGLALGARVEIECWALAGGAPATGAGAAPPAIGLGGAPRAAGGTIAGTVRADTFWSQALGVRKQYVVYLPASYAAERARRYPVVYYLHGMYGDEWNWVRFGKLDATMDSLAAACATRGQGAGARGAGAHCAGEMIVVMPDGDDGWYTTWNTLGNWADCRRKPMREDESADAYCVPWPHYDDYVAHDLVAHVDSSYRTLAGRAHRGIAGLSMGGYGAVTLALRYPDVFAAAASHSGVLSPLYAGPRPFAPPVRYARDMDSVRAEWGNLWPFMRMAFGADTAAWLARDPARMTRQLNHITGELMPALFFDTGRDDRLVVEGNRAFDAELTALGVPHRYAEWPGAHNWTYWTAHVGESLTWLAGEIGGRP